MSTHEEIEYAIIGGGIAGLCLGIALHHRGIEVQIYEAARGFGEIGAGVGFTPNAIQAMRICHPGIHDSFQQIAKLDSEKKEFNYDCYDVAGTTEAVPKPTLVLKFKDEIKGIHRAQFLDAMVQYFPQDQVHFRKRLDSYQQTSDGTYSLAFRDGTTARAQAIIGCDGIKSHVRRCMLGAEHPSVPPSYTHKYAYRAMVPIDDAIEAIGQEKCKGPTFFFGKDGHVLTLPVPSYKVLQIVAFCTDPDDWPDSEHLTAPSTKEDMLRDFHDFGPDIHKLLSLVKPGMDKWAIFDLCKNPPPFYAQGRVAILGDAAHATSPHHGAGAGMCIEDAAVLSELLGDTNAKSLAGVEAAFTVYDAVRRPRGEMLVASSRFTGDAYEGRQASVGRNWEALAAEVYKRTGRVHDVDVGQFCEKARTMLEQASRGVEIGIPQSRQSD